MQVNFQKHLLKFKFPAGTSRGVMYDRPVWYVTLTEGEKSGKGEVAPLIGLSKESYTDTEKYLISLTGKDYSLDDLHQMIMSERVPNSIRFGLESALLDYENKGCYFYSDFIKGKKAITINGLIWMGEKDTMFERAADKLKQGFECIKVKIGAINWEDEYSLIQFLRKEGGDDLEIRTDANGAFTMDEARKKMQQLADVNVHSIEQPLAKNNETELAELSKENILPVALDEELLGHESVEDAIQKIKFIKPPYLVLKPGLLGGFTYTDKLIEFAESENIAWWITSALESNIGLTAIAQYTATKKYSMAQGLGTGELYENNVEGKLYLNGQYLNHKP